MRDQFDTPWVKCGRCKTTRPASAIADGVCIDTKLCEKLGDTKPVNLWPRITITTVPPAQLVFSRGVRA